MAIYEISNCSRDPVPKIGTLFCPVVDVVLNLVLNLSDLVYILLLPLYCNINCMNLDILVNFEKCQYSCGDHWSKWPPVWRPRGLVMLFQRWEPRRKQPSPSSGSFQGSPINMIPAGLTSHACDPSTAIGKSLRKVGTLDAVTLGNPIHFAPFLHPLLWCS